MRVFVTGTGRCGTVTFRMACTHITNYRNGHETRNGLFEWPDNFIEVNPHIRGSVTAIHAKYPHAKWVHLIRKPGDCIPSLAAMGRGLVMEYYGRILPSIFLSPDNADIAYRIYWQENDLIRVQLEQLIPPENRRQIWLHEVSDPETGVWQEFWDWIQAEGDFEASLAEWSVKHNSRTSRGE